MAKETHQVEVYDAALGTTKVATLEMEGPELVLQSLNPEIVANAIYGSPGNKCVIEARLVLKDRMGKRRR